MRADIDDLLQACSIQTSRFDLASRLYRALRAEVERLYTAGQTDQQIMTALLTTYSQTVACILQAKLEDAKLQLAEARHDQIRHHLSQRR